MSFCAKCGKLLDESSAHCGGCGASRAPRSPAAVPISSEGSANTVAPASSNAGITPNVAGALSYLLGVVSGVIFLVLDPYKQDRTVRFHAFQSIFFALAWVGLWIIWTILTGVFEAITGGFLAVLIIPIDCLLTLAGIAYWAFLIYRAYEGRRHKILFLGQLAEQFANK
jgi:uncharacterized membrane protein